MKSQVLYVEHKIGHGDNGPAWIGKGHFSKSGQTVYFNGLILKKGHGISGNYFETESGDEYWISGVKKRGTNRHWAGGGKIAIDREFISHYLDETGLSELPKNMFEIVDLIREPAKAKNNQIENSLLDEKRENSPDYPEYHPFAGCRFKKPNELSDEQLAGLLDYYETEEKYCVHKKGRRFLKSKQQELMLEQEKRINNASKLNWKEIEKETQDMESGKVKTIAARQAALQLRKILKSR